MGTADSDAERYRVNLEALEAFANQLAKFDRAAEKRSAEVDRKISALHENFWTGVAAAAHKQLHQEWLEGVAQMRRAEEELEDTARYAHFNYTQAIAHNRKMWPPA